MPKIYLKPNSAEYADADEKQTLRYAGCEMPGCTESAEFKAPKNWGLDEHYHFCLTHIQEYNKAWDYFSGMAQADIEDHIVRSAMWDRPTWRFDSYTNLEDGLKNRAWQSYHFTDKDREQTDRTRSPFERNSPEYEAMALMDLSPPLSLVTIKARYKELAKKHHPDVNHNNPESEELLKKINMAYTILKLACDKYEQLKDK